ncbi:copper homeostasis protein CutC [Plantibacter sp. RU18]|uniref:copper homeostasis protein CutC n=1 Tax=Plantibacter sp. RU18 TaxID=3158143 RepID=UPI003D36D48B
MSDDTGAPRVADPIAEPVPQRRTVVEVCVDDLAGAISADRAGADRIELCADLLEGGTTPSLGLIGTVLAAVRDVDVQVIVRPRGGDFVYDDGELDVMCADLAAIADVARRSTLRVGVVLGALTTGGSVDVSAMRRLSDAAGGLPVTFHKAFDATPDLFAAYDTLAGLGVERVLTAGGPGSALDGVEVLAELVRRSLSEPSLSEPSPAGVARPSILVGGSVRPSNVRQILDATDAREVHLRAQVPAPRGDGTLATDPTIVRAMRAAVDDATGRAAASPVSLASDVVVIAVDIGGTNLKGAIIDSTGRALASRSVGVGRTGEESIQRIIELLKTLRGQTESAGQTVVGVGVVTPGMVDAAQGIVRYASTLDWTDVPLGPILSAELGVPVEVGHDVRSAGLAESLFGASAGVADSVLVAIGTGVAASIISSGNAVVGAVTTAGELGHIPAIPDGEDCTCGQRGCLEVYLSGAGLARRYAALGGDPTMDAAAISTRLGQDDIADRVWADGVHALALGLKSVTLLIDPEVVVLAGGVSRAGATLVEPVVAALQDSLVWRAAPEIRLSMLGTSGGRIGAAVLAFRAAGRGDLVDMWTTASVLQAAA